MKKIEQKTYVIDATDKILGRLATKIADLLRGKGKVYFVPNADVGDKVVVINCEKIKVTGGKEEKKIYYHHTGFPGGIRDISYKALMEKDPTQIIKKAVLSMLPKNKLQNGFIKKLTIIVGNDYTVKDGDIKLDV
ncbi:MAG TPA: 50S ribosomal protein L13 [Patescibacteria group bacterium]|nr:50S ribosomal protein L13 [Patescibacteria group bacterium]